MVTSPVKSFFLSPLLVSCTVFTCLTFPLVSLGSKSVVIELQKEPIFAGKLKDVATPYLGLAGVISLGAGIVSLSVAGWRKSFRQSTQAENQLSSLQQALKEKETQLEELKLSELQLQAQGLSEFIGAPAIASHPSHEYSPVSATVPVSNQPAPPTLATVEALPTSHKIQGHKAQAPDTPSHQPLWLTITPLNSHLDYLNVTPLETPKSSSDTLSEINELQNQLKQIVSQVETLQNSLKHSAQSTSVPESGSSTVLIEHLYQRIQLLENQWRRQEIMS